MCSAECSQTKIWISNRWGARINSEDPQQVVMVWEWHAHTTREDLATTRTPKASEEAGQARVSMGKVALTKLMVTITWAMAACSDRVANKACSNSPRIPMVEKTWCVAQPRGTVVNSSTVVAQTSLVVGVSSSLEELWEETICAVWTDKAPWEWIIKADLDRVSMHLGCKTQVDMVETTFRTLCSITSSSIKTINSWCTSSGRLPLSSMSGPSRTVASLSLTYTSLMPMRAELSKTGSW